MIDPSNQPTKSHFSNWLEGYFWPIVILIVMEALCLAYPVLTGYKTVSDPWAWVIELMPLAFKLILAILFASIFKQQVLGAWMTKEQQLANPFFALGSQLLSVIALAIFIYALGK